MREPARGPQPNGETGKPRRRAFLSRRRLSPVRIRVSSLATEEKVSDRFRIVNRGRAQAADAQETSPRGYSHRQGKISGN